MTRELRLASILFLLKSNKSQTSVELAQTLKVNVRTIYRDIEVLVEAGLPIRGTQGPSGGYVLAEHFPVDPLVYSSNEALSLISIPKDETTDREPLRLGQAIDSAVKLLAEELPEVASALVNRVRSRFLFDTSNWFCRDAELGQFPELKEAILNDLTIEVIHTERGTTALRTDGSPEASLRPRSRRRICINHSVFDSIRQSF